MAQDGQTTETLNLRVDSGEMSNAAQESETVQLMTVPNNSLNKLNDMSRWKRPVTMGGSSCPISSAKRVAAL